MTVLPGPSTGRDDARSSRPVARPAEGVLARADGVELIGEMKGSGYRRPPALVRRADGQTFQLTPLLYVVLEAVDGHRSADEVAEHVSRRVGRTVTGDNVRTLVNGQLRTMGLLVRPDGSQPEVKKSNPLLALRFKYAVSDPERTRRLTSPFARLFNPVVVVAVLAAFLGVCWWVFMQKGLASATYEAFNSPGLLLLVLAVTVLSAGFHEFGHAAAARRGGATPGVMGAGVYLVWPAFYTDVTDSYRLGRAGRIRTDLGGLYFNAIVAVLVAGTWWATGYDSLLLVVATQILQMVRQLTPLVRFDGYHVLADLTGVPDLFQRIKPTLLGLLPWRWRHPETTVLKPWARAVVTVWVLVVVPVLVFSIFTMVLALPRLLGTAWAALGKQYVLLGRAWSDADFLESAARVVGMIAVAFPVIAMLIIVTRLARWVVKTALRRTRGRPFRRALAAVLGACLVTGLAYAWWPHPGRYRPIQPYEGGTLVQAMSVIRPAPSPLVEGQYGRLVTSWAPEDPRPTIEHPQLALVLVPNDTGESAPAAGPSADPTTGTAAVPSAGDTPAPAPDGSAGADGPTGSTEPQAWVFPFNKPLAPGEGDNQALSVNTQDNTVTYSVAFALVWIEDDSPALNKNEAYAFASCKDCAAVAVGFQVVLVTGENHVAVPQNLAGALNYNCVNCLTYALATQLFLTLDGPLSDDGMRQIAEIWDEVATFGQSIPSVPLTDIQARLADFEQQIIAVIEKEQGPFGGAPDATGSPTAGAESSGTASPSASPGGSPSGTSPGVDGSATAGPDGSAGTGSSAGPSSSPGGSATSSPEGAAPGGTASGADGTAPSADGSPDTSPDTSPDGSPAGTPAGPDGSPASSPADNTESSPDTVTGGASGSSPDATFSTAPSTTQDASSAPAPSESSADGSAAPSDSGTSTFSAPSPTPEASLIAGTASP